MQYRLVQKKDAAALAAIQAPYVAQTAITFLYDIPTAETFEHKIETLMPRYPFLCAEEEGEILGYAYASDLRPHEAFGWDVELSIYIRRDCKRRGIGTGLMERIVPLCERMGFCGLYSCITLPNPGSIALHKKFDFQQVGMFPNSGYKLNEWHSVIWLLRMRPDFPKEPRPTIPLTDIPADELAELLK